MKRKETFWLDWKSKKIYLNKQAFCSWEKVEEIEGTINCSHWDWSLILLEEKKKRLFADQEKRVIRVGSSQAIIKEIYQGNKEKPQGEGVSARNLLLELVPEFTSVHPSTDQDFAEAVAKWKWGQRWEEWEDADLAWLIDQRKCFANIMRNYSLPCGKPQHIKKRGSKLIEQQLQEKKQGFVKFYLEGYAKIKKKQIPFIPNYNPVIKNHQSLLLYTKLFAAFKKQYKIVGKIIYTDFWILNEKKGCANKFLDYCQQKEQQAQAKEEKKEWKNKPNILWGILGQKNLGGYRYYPWHLAILQISLLQGYYLYRQFKPENVLAIRADAILVRAELPAKITNQPELYQIKRLGLKKREVFDYETEELKSPLSNLAREESLKIWLKRKNERLMEKHLINSEWPKLQECKRCSVPFDSQEYHLDKIFQSYGYCGWTCLIAYFPILDWKTQLVYLGRELKNNPWQEWKKEPKGSFVYCSPKDYSLIKKATGYQKCKENPQWGLLEETIIKPLTKKAQEKIVCYFTLRGLREEAEEVKKIFGFPSSPQIWLDFLKQNESKKLRGLFLKTETREGKTFNEYWQTAEEKEIKNCASCELKKGIRDPLRNIVLKVEGNLAKGLDLCLYCTYNYLDDFARSRWNKEEAKKEKDLQKLIKWIEDNLPDNAKEKANHMKAKYSKLQPNNLGGGKT
jgi:hypothetical protein